MTQPPAGFGFGRRTDWTRERFPGTPTVAVRLGVTAVRLPGHVLRDAVVTCAVDAVVCLCLVTIPAYHRGRGIS